MGVTEEEIKAHQEYLKYNDKICKLVGAVPRSNYIVDVPFKMVESELKKYQDCYGLELIPDFQRGHVWTEEQQIKYIEAIVKGTVAASSRIVTFNCSDWGDNNSDEVIKDMVCIDGLQRLTAVRRWMNDEFTIFNDLFEYGVSKEFFDRTSLTFNSLSNGLKFAILGMQTKEEILKYYLAFNDGGTVHSPEEIARVKQMLKDLENEA